jgi:DNA-binding transcriptional ArsR family regulator
MNAEGTNAERLRILELLAEHKITASEAAELLGALGERGRARRGRWQAENLGPPRPDRARWFRVRVTDQRTGRTRTNISVPIGMVGFGLSFARRFGRISAATGVDDLFEAVREGRRGTIFDIANDDGDRVEILID